MKNEKGAITLYVTIVCLFILIVGIASYVQITNQQTAQKERLNQIEESYTTGNWEELYKKYEIEDIIPIYTAEQLNRIGKGEEVYIPQTGKIYKFDIDKTYVLQNNIFFEGEWENTNYLIKSGLITFEKQGNTIISTDATGVLTTDNFVIKQKNSETQIVIPKGFAPVSLNSDGSVNKILQPEDWLSISSKDIEDGVVIVDNEITYTNGIANFNEFVWVPVNGKVPAERQNTKGQYPVYYGGKDFGLQSTERLIQIESYPAGYTDEKDEIISREKINKYKGFYIGRYEAYLENGVLYSKRNVQPTNEITWNECNDASKKLYTGIGKQGVTSRLLYGAEWDTVIAYINSSCTDYAYDISKYGNTANTGNGLVNTGKTTDRQKNIYDMAGNLQELTLERMALGRADRGSSYQSYCGTATHLGEDGSLNYRWEHVGTRLGFTIMDNDITLMSKNTNIVSSINAIIKQWMPNEVDISKCKYVYVTQKEMLGVNSEIWSSANVFQTNPQIISLKAEQAGTYYLHILTVDKNEDKKETVSDGVNDVDYEATNVSAYGYDVYYYTNNPNITKVQFPTWTEKNGQDDLANGWDVNPITAGTKIADGTWYYRVNRRDHNGEYGDYATHTYAYNSSGTWIDFKSTYNTIPEVAAAERLVSGDIYYYPIKDNITNVKFPTWTNANGQDDLIWHQAEKLGSNVYYYKIKSEEHNNEKAFYITHIYEYIGEANQHVCTLNYSL